MRTRSAGITAVAALGVAALLGSVGCNSTDDLATLRTQGTGAAQVQPVSGYPGAPVLQGAAASSSQSGNVLVTCEPHQRTLVRPVMVNGQSMSQVECVSTSALPAGYDPQMMQYAPAQAVPTYYSTAAARPVRTVSYEPAPQRRYVRRSTVSYAPERSVRQGRSMKKSLIIIGSSAGIGAGVGAAAGGKKGALIGAAIGGGGAAIWDQITRNKDR
jgi:hypothetical protein